jgi:RecB family exonuclease
VPTQGLEERLARQIAPLEVSTSRRQRFSVTGLSDYLRCPRGYHLRYVEGVPSGLHGSLERRRLTDAETGSVVHRALQRLGRRGAPSVSAAVRACLREQGLAAAADEQTRAWLEHLVERYRESGTYALVQQAERLKTEMSVTVPLGEALVEGRIDAAAWSPDGRLELVDFKTGAPAKIGTDPTSPEAFQMGLYCYAAEQALGRLPDGARIHYLGADEWVTVDPAEASQEAVPVARQAIAAIQAGDFPPRSPERCVACDLAWACQNAM